MTTMRMIAVGCTAVAAAVGATLAQAQDVSAFAGATELQKRTGAAVTATCGSLNQALGGGNASTSLQATGPSGDLFRRCNELVVTGQDITNGTAPAPGTGRTLGLTSTQLLEALQQVSGEEVNAQGSLSTDVPSGQFANIGGRLNTLRFVTSGASSGGKVAALDSGSRSPRSEVTSRDWGSTPRGGGAASDAGGVNNPWGWFLESSYGFGDHDQTEAEDQFDFDSVSLTTGTDYNFGNAVLGFAIGYDQYQADFDNSALVSGGEVEVKGVSGSVFGALFGAGGWWLDGIAAYGQLDSDISRKAFYTSNTTCAVSCGLSAVRTLTASPEGSYIALGASLGYGLQAGDWDISPALTLSYRDVDIDSFQETDTTANGGLALAYDDQTIKSTRTILGVGFSRPVSTSFGVVTPNFRAEWHHEFEDDPRSISARYVFAPTTNCVGCNFEFLSDEIETDYGVVGAGVSAVFAQRLQAYLYYEALVGVSDVSSNSIALGLRGQF